MPSYTFAKTRPWDGARTIDPGQPTATVKVQKTGPEGVRRAMAKLGSPGAGRQWVLITHPGQSHATDTSKETTT